MADPPMPVMTALDRFLDTVARGNRWQDPNGEKVIGVEDGYVEIKWLTKKECFRVTLDFNLKEDS